MRLKYCHKFSIGQALRIGSLPNDSLVHGRPSHYQLQTALPATASTVGRRQLRRTNVPPFGGFPQVFTSELLLVIDQDPVTKLG